MKAVPCPLCGYDAWRVERGSAARSDRSVPALCPHCGLAPREPSLRGPRAGSLEGFLVGLVALPRGLYFLAATPGVKRWLLPPLLLTLAAFGALFWWLWTWVQRLMEMLRSSGQEQLELDPAWLERALQWLLGLKMFVWLAQAGSLFVFLLVSAVAAFWAFSIVYEAVSGPFLDEIHGIVEERWFGVDPRNRMHRQTRLSTRACALWSTGAGAVALGGAAALWLWVAWPLWLALLVGVTAPFAAAAALQREYGRWLLWVIRLEGGTLWVSVKAALVAAVFLVIFFPIKFVPGIGYLLFGAVAGFTTAVSLLDIPFERRQWSLSQRFAFLFRHALAVIPYGVVASLLFILPVVGPLLMVPAASVGGLWMLARLDKDFLRPAEHRLGAWRPPPRGPAELPGGRTLELPPAPPPPPPGE
jgi:uncharacterized protein involved in cysteine biosynthesis